MIRRLRSQRGFALITVLGVMLMILVYIVTVHGAVELSARQARLSAQRQGAAEAMSDALTRALACDAPDPGPGGAITRTPLPAEHPLWRVLPSLTPQAGDELLAVTVATPQGVRCGRFIVNRQGLRSGAIALDSAEGAPVSPSPTPAPMKTE